MNHYNYEADVGSIKMIHESGAAIMISNDYGDGEFDFYVATTREEIEAKFGKAIEEKIWLNQTGWKVMFYDCSNQFKSEGLILNSKFTRVFKKGSTFIFQIDEE